MTSLDATFHALADPTRRGILARLGENGRLTAGDIAAPLAMSLPAALKHLGVLEAAGLVRREKIGRTVHVELTAGPMSEASAWLTNYERFWSCTLDRLQTYLETETCPPPRRLVPAESARPTPKPKADRASRSFVKSPRRPKGSSRR